MPRKAEWLQQLPGAIKALKKLTMPVVDRATLEALLGIHRRAAIRLMSRFGGYQAGRTFLIERPALIRQLEIIASTPSFEHDTQRRQKLVAELERVQREIAARRIQIAVAANQAREIAGLPPTIRLASGRLEIDCADAQDLLRQLMQLAQAIATDFERFESVVGAISSRERI